MIDINGTPHAAPPFSKHYRSQLGGLFPNRALLNRPDPINSDSIDILLTTANVVERPLFQGCNPIMPPPAPQRFLLVIVFGKSPLFLK